MQLYSTNNPENIVSLKEAVLKGLPKDNGLYLPVSIPRLHSSFYNHIAEYSFSDLSYELSKSLFQGFIPEKELYRIVYDAINFPAPLVKIKDNIYILELFHGPSLAFKDFGARFMAQLMSYFNRGEKRELVVLVATSGDTGGAVAAGFHNIPGVRVVILFPSGRVSKLQELQLTTWGGNIQTLEVDGSFDDCQALVKKAFLDEDLSKKIRLTSANSINIARLIPQSFYYFEGYKQLLADYAEKKPPVFVVPSGNFGNLTAGVMAMKMGLPVEYFLAATNINDTVPMYLSLGVYRSKRSLATLSNAMDVGAPSNFRRLEALFKGDSKGSTWNNMRKAIKGYAYSDRQVKDAIRRVSTRMGYALDPHTAVGLLAAEQELAIKKEELGPLVVLGTAHPVKFLNKTSGFYSGKVGVPEEVLRLEALEPNKARMSSSFTVFKNWLLKYMT